MCDDMSKHEAGRLAHRTYSTCALLLPSRPYTPPYTTAQTHTHTHAHVHTFPARLPAGIQVAYARVKPTEVEREVPQAQ
eukprot:55780-Eustigmatos_ZCMA.PRE.1